MFPAHLRYVYGQIYLQFVRGITNRALQGNPILVSIN